MAIIYLIPAGLLLALLVFLLTGALLRKRKKAPPPTSSGKMLAQDEELPPPLFCEACKQPLPHGSAFCLYCGARVKNGAPPTFTPRRFFAAIGRGLLLALKGIGYALSIVAYGIWCALCAIGKFFCMLGELLWSVVRTKAFLVTVAVLLVVSLPTVFILRGVNKKTELYEDACLALESGNHEEALELFEELGGFKDSESKRLDAMYEYVLEHLNNDDPVTYEYLRVLKQEDHREAGEIYHELYDWKITVVAINTSENDKLNTYDAISKYDTAYCHIKLTGGTPGADTWFYGRTVGPVDEQEPHVFKKKWSDGGTGWFSWYYINPSSSSQTGTVTFEFYDSKGNCMGSASVEIVN